MIDSRFSASSVAVLHPARSASSVEVIHPARSASSVEVIHPALIAPVITIVSRSQTALPPARGHDLGVCCPCFFRLANFRTLASLHPEGLCGLCLDFVLILNFTSLLLCGAILLAASWPRPKAFVANDALVLRISRVQVTRTARALMARSLGPSDAELALSFGRPRRVRGASALTRSSFISVESRAASGLNHHGWLVGSLPGDPL